MQKINFIIKNIIKYIWKLGLNIIFSLPCYFNSIFNKKLNNILYIIYHMSYHNQKYNIK